MDVINHFSILIFGKHLCHIDLLDNHDASCPDALEQSTPPQEPKTTSTIIYVNSMLQSDTWSVITSLSQESTSY